MFLPREHKNRRPCVSYNTASLVKTIIEMGKNLSFELIAKGIENEQQVAFLQQSGCRFGQGYLYSPPLPAEEVGTVLLLHSMGTQEPSLCVPLPSKKESENGI